MVARMFWLFLCCFSYADDGILVSRSHRHSRAYFLSSTNALFMCCTLIKIIVPCLPHENGILLSPLGTRAKHMLARSLHNYCLVKFKRTQLRTISIDLHSNVIKCNDNVIASNNINSSLLYRFSAFSMCSQGTLGLGDGMIPRL